MADEITSDKPLADLAAAEQRIEPPAHEPAPVDEPMTAVDRLRAFEDEKLGKDTPRQNGAIERGVGSHFSRMADADKAMHAKLEKLIETESKLSAAHSALIAADVEHDAALKAVDG